MIWVLDDEQDDPGQGHRPQTRSHNSLASPLRSGHQTCCLLSSNGRLFWLYGDLAGFWRMGFRVFVNLAEKSKIITVPSCLKKADTWNFLSERNVCIFYEFIQCISMMLRIQ